MVEWVNECENGEFASKKFEITVKLVLKFMKIYKECASMHINDLVNLFQNLFTEIMTAIRYMSSISLTLIQSASERLWALAHPKHTYFY